MYSERNVVVSTLIPVCLVCEPVKGKTLKAQHIVIVEIPVVSLQGRGGDESCHPSSEAPPYATHAVKGYWNLWTLVEAVLVPYIILYEERKASYKRKKQLLP